MIFGVEFDEPFVEAKRLGLAPHLLVEFGNAEDHCRIEPVVPVPLLEDWNGLVVAFRPHQPNEPLEAVLEVRVHFDGFSQPKARLVGVLERLPPLRDFEAEARQVSDVAEPLEEQHGLLFAELQPFAALSGRPPSAAHFRLAADFEQPFELFEGLLVVVDAVLVHCLCKDHFPPEANAHHLLNTQAPMPQVFSRSLHNAEIAKPFASRNALMQIDAGLC